MEKLEEASRHKPNHLIFLWCKSSDRIPNFSTAGEDKMTYSPVTLIDALVQLPVNANI